MTKMPSKHDTSWESVADWYDAHLASGDTYQSRLILPNLKKLAVVSASTQLLDVACGQGFFSKAFADMGARITGVDSSTTLVEKARVLVPTGAFHVSDATAMPFLSNSAFDVALCVLGLQNMENPAHVVREVARGLRASGTFHVVLNHPAFRVPGRSSWGWDEKNKIQYRRVDGYLLESKEKIFMHPGEDVTNVTYSFHRPLQYYVKILANAGFAITRMQEWISDRSSQPGPRADAENTARQEFPLFLYLEAQKLK